MTSTDPHSHGHRRDNASGPMQNPDVGHEDTDINVRTVLSFGAGMVIVAVTCVVIIRVLFGVLSRQAIASDPPPTSAVARPVGQLPRAPILLTNERAALAKFHAEEAKTLDGYGWVDQVGGVTHIPVDEAKKLLVQRGLPARAAAADTLEGTHAAAMGEASGGRTVPSKPAGPAAAPAGAQPEGAASPARPNPNGAK
jgi:hypothetical protein